ncbi:hypothetical protein D8674_034422 [Pyrus ussuriensis x Pyrus communis]|uniref:Uncharacterized protein n=1 Tax=Pyrus ussuriensis x Pyrus communis TaxID=2448454 RepID=A0A5N5HS15_9ROSA|nr:hypothetical protein D8674_034422 [Pyrus ussuriensis x Pyrus communis]
MGNNCPTIEWHSWNDVSENTKKAVMDELLKKVKANSINQSKKKILHRSGSRCFSYRLEEGSKFPKIDIFKKVYVRPRDELTQQLHLPLETPMEEVFSPEDAWFQIMTDTLDQTLGRRHGNVHLGLGKGHLQDPSASSSRQRTKQVETLTSEIAAQNNWMNQIHRALQISSIQFPDFELAPETTSQPFATAATTSQPPNTATTPPTNDCDIADIFF